MFGVNHSRPPEEASLYAATCRAPNDGLGGVIDKGAGGAERGIHTVANPLYPFLTCNLICLH
jgi:hypothetical protein